MHTQDLLLAQQCLRKYQEVADFTKNYKKDKRFPMILLAIYLSICYNLYIEYVLKQGDAQCLQNRPVKSRP